MRILVNGVWRETCSQQLAETLAELGYSGRAVATAVNDEFVAAEARAQLELKEGDRVEVLAPMQGG